MRLSPRRLALPAAAAMLAALLSAPATTSVAATEQADPLLGAPKVGQCLDMTRKVASSDASLKAPGISCKKEHTIWITAVAEVPAQFADDMEGDGYDAFVVNLCYSAVKPAIGDNRLKYAMSSYSWYSFRPTDAQREAGAAWVVCGIGAYGTATTLQSSKDKLPAKLTKTLPSNLRLCGSADFKFTHCGVKHAYTANYATRVAGNRKKAQQYADNICPNHVTSINWMWASRSSGPKHFLLTCLTK